MLPATAIHATYRLRWEVETFFKVAKSGSAMNELPSSKEAVVRILLTAGLLRATLSMRTRAAVLRRFAPGLAHQATGLVKWVRWWNEQLGDVLWLMMGRISGWRAPTPHEVLLSLLDPNREHRPPTRLTFATGGT